MFVGGAGRVTQSADKPFKECLGKVTPHGQEPLFTKGQQDFTAVMFWTKPGELPESMEGKQEREAGLLPQRKWAIRGRTILRVNAGRQLMCLDKQLLQLGRHRAVSRLVGRWCPKRFQQARSGRTSPTKRKYLSAVVMVNKPESAGEKVVEKMLG